jgi:hypothetical protein
MKTSFSSKLLSSFQDYFGNGWWPDPAWSAMAFFKFATRSTPAFVIAPDLNVLFLLHEQKAP